MIGETKKFRNAEVEELNEPFERDLISLFKLVEQEVFKILDEANSENGLTEDELILKINQLFE